MVGMWAELITTSTIIESGLKIAPYIVLTTGTLFFIAFQVLAILSYLYPFNVTINIIANSLICLVVLSEVIFPLIFGSILLKKLNKTKKISTSQRSIRLIRKTKLIMGVSIILGIFLILLIVYVSLQAFYIINSVSNFVFEFIFRLPELISVALSISLCTGVSFKKTISNCILNRKSNFNSNT